MSSTEKGARCTHPHVKTFRSHPPRSECQDCGAVVELRWCDPAADMSQPGSDGAA